MKKLLLLATFMLLGIASLFAQVEIKGLGGLNFATFHNSGDAEVSAKAGYQFGAGVLIGNKFYVEPGIQFVSSTKTITENSTSFDFSQSFVKIPVYAGYHLLGSEDSPFALRIFAGPTMSIPGKIKKGEDQIDKDRVKSAIWAVDGGLGFDFFFLFVEANYEYSFNDYFVDDISNAKHGAFIINAGVHIDF